MNKETRQMIVGMILFFLFLACGIINVYGLLQYNQWYNWAGVIGNITALYWPITLIEKSVK